MLCCIDIGNTNTDLYLSLNGIIINKFCFKTKQNSFYNLIKKQIKSFILLNNVDDVIISSVVPSLDQYYHDLIVDLINIEPMFIKYNSKLNETITFYHPETCGADLICSTVAAIEKYKAPLIVVDMGTATKFLLVNEKNEFFGASIAPGLKGSLGTLFETAEMLKIFRLEKADNVIGKDTVSCIESGALYGHASMIDGMIERFKKELNNNDIKVILTGGLSEKVHALLNTNVIHDANLLPEGMIIIHELNK